MRGIGAGGTAIVRVNRVSTPSAIDAIRSGESVGPSKVTTARPRPSCRSAINRPARHDARAEELDHPLRMLARPQIELGSALKPPHPQVGRLCSKAHGRDERRYPRWRLGICHNGQRVAETDPPTRGRILERLARRRVGAAGVDGRDHDPSLLSQVTCVESGPNTRPRPLARQSIQARRTRLVHHPFTCRSNLLSASVEERQAKDFGQEDRNCALKRDRHRGDGGEVTSAAQITWSDKGPEFRVRRSSNDSEERQPGRQMRACDHGVAAGTGSVTESLNANTEIELPPFGLVMKNRCEKISLVRVVIGHLSQASAWQRRLLALFLTARERQHPRNPTAPRTFGNHGDLPPCSKKLPASFHYESCNRCKVSIKHDHLFL